MGIEDWFGETSEFLDFTFEKYSHNYRGNDIARCILLRGPSGSGKSLLIKELSRKYKLNLHHLNAAEAFLQSDTLVLYEYLDTFFYKVQCTERPSILFIQRIEEFFVGEDKNIIFYKISNWISNLPPNVLLISTTNQSFESSNYILSDSSWTNLEMPLELSYYQRESLIDFFLPLEFDNDTSKMKDPEIVLDCSFYSSGFLAGDILELLREISIRDEPVRSVAFRIRKRLGFRKVSIEPVSWKDIFGHEKVIKELKRISNFLIDPNLREAYRLKGLSNPRGVILYGPPGTGKTLLAKALASEYHEVHFISIQLHQVIHSEVGESEKTMSLVFKEAIRLQPSIIFFDEFDALSSSDDSDLSSIISLQISEELDLLSNNDLVLVVAATNLLDKINPSLRRFKRFSKEIFVGELEVEEQIKLANNFFEKCNCALPDEFLKMLDRPITGAQLKRLINSYMLKGMT